MLSNCILCVGVAIRLLGLKLFPLVSYHEEALFGLTSVRKVREYLEDAYSRLDFASPPYL